MIALVVTIVILIILAVISINAVLGEDGLIASAERGSIEHTHATVWEAMEMEYSNYWIDKVMLGGDLITYLQGEDKGIIGQELQGTGYVINVEKLLGTRMSLGNGTDGVNDVYKLEPLQTEEANITKVASTEESIKLAEETTKSESEYQVKYYGPSGDRVLGILGDNISSLVESDNPNFEIKKEETSTPSNGEYYKVGDTIEYTITVKNTGDVTMNDIHITDVLVSGSGIHTPGNENIKQEANENVETGEGYWIIKSLGANTTETIKYKYTVQTEDTGKQIINTITNVTGNPEPKLPKGHRIPEVEIPPEEVGRYGSIEIEKTLLNYVHNSPCICVFNIEAKVNGKIVYSTIRGVTCFGSGVTTIIINDIPIGAEVTVEEVYSGSCYSLTDSTPKKQTIILDNEREIKQIYFENEVCSTYREGGYGIINLYRYNGKKYEIEQDPMELTLKEKEFNIMPVLVATFVEMQEEMHELDKHITIKNWEDSNDRVYVRLKVFAPTEILEYLDFASNSEENGWKYDETDGYIYYEPYLNADETSNPLIIDVNIPEEYKKDFEIVVVFEYTPVRYYEDGSPYCIWD